MLTKAIPLMVMAAGASQNKQQLQVLIDYVRGVAVQVEVNEIAKMIMLDKISGDKLPTPEQVARAVTVRPW